MEDTTKNVRMQEGVRERGRETGKLVEWAVKVETGGIKVRNGAATLGTNVFRGRGRTATSIFSQAVGKGMVTHVETERERESGGSSQRRLIDW
jgi:hypothetical protein